MSRQRPCYSEFIDVPSHCHVQQAEIAGAAGPETAEIRPAACRHPVPVGRPALAAHHALQLGQGRQPGRAAVSGTPRRIDVVSDVVCPWCFIGLRHLQAALAQFGSPVTVRWLPFFLNPDTPPAGEPYRPFLERKFGGAEALERIWARVRAAGEPVGIAFAFEKIALRANTLAAHRLIHRVQARGGNADALVERIFTAGFCEGRFIGDPAVLADLAAEVATNCGEDRDVTLAWLQGDEDAAAVQAQAAQIRQLGIDGVPCFIFDGRLAVSGAQPSAVLLDALRQAQA